MIHHISIPAENPQHVAQVLAELWQGKAKAVPFPPHPGSYMVLVFDDYGTAIEVYPLGTEMLPGIGEQQASFSMNVFASSFVATHIALSVPANEDEIVQIAKRENWRVVRCSREDLFEVIEFWVENRLLIELLPPAIAPKYLAVMQSDELKAFFDIPMPATV